MIIYVHIPKTAGTSFRQGMLQVYERKDLLFDYGLDSPETDKAIGILYKQGIFSPRLILGIVEDGIQAICGHFPLAKYFQVLPNATVVSFVREPLQRCYSEYLHWKRYKGYSCSFEDFFKQKGQINLQSRWLADLPENALVGVSESYDKSLRMINSALGLSIPALMLNCHREDVNIPYEIEVLTKDVVLSFYELNKRDVSFYNTILRRFF